MSDLKTALKAELSAINKVTNLVAKLPPDGRVKVLKYVLDDAVAESLKATAEKAAVTQAEIAKMNERIDTQLAKLGG